MSNDPHNHHFVPQFLLKHFSSDRKKIWVYDMESKTIKRRSIKKTASVKDLYAHKRGDGSIDSKTVEEGCFSQVVENNAAPAIRKLLAREVISIEAALSFFLFVAAQLCRTPAFFSQIHDSNAPVLQEMCERIAKFDVGFREHVTARMKASGASQEEIDRLFAAMGNGGMKVAPTREFVLHQSLQLIEDVAKHFEKMHWCFLSVPAGDPDLIISDHPVTLHDGDPSSGGQRPFGILTPGAEIMLPLSRRMVACGKADGPVRYGQLEPGAVSVANARSMRSAQRYVYASCHSDALLQEAILQKSAGPKLHVHRKVQGQRLTIATAFY